MVNHTYTLRMVNDIGSTAQYITTDFKEIEKVFSFFLNMGYWATLRIVTTRGRRKHFILWRNNNLIQEDRL